MIPRQLRPHWPNHSLFCTNTLKDTIENTETNTKTDTNTNTNTKANTKITKGNGER